MAREAKFFEALGNSNAAQVRDFLVHNRASLADYRARSTTSGAQSSRTATSCSPKKKLHDEMLATTRKIVGEFVVVDRTVKEKLAYMAQFPLTAASRSRTRPRISSTCPMAWVRRRQKPPDAWPKRTRPETEGNQAFMGRIANYKALLQAEKGGVLPLFKETRREVYEYWERNKVDVARDWMARFRESLRAGGWDSARRQGSRKTPRISTRRVRAHGKALQGGRGRRARIRGQVDRRIQGSACTQTIDELVTAPPWQ